VESTACFLLRRPSAFTLHHQSSQRFSTHFSISSFWLTTVCSDIVDLVRGGAIDEAIKLIRSAFPQLLDKHPEVRFKLLCQRFIELIRQRKKEEALLFAQKEWSPHAKDDPSLLDELQVRIRMILLLLLLLHVAAGPHRDDRRVGRVCADRVRGPGDESSAPVHGGGLQGPDRAPRQQRHPRYDHYSSPTTTTPRSLITIISTTTEHHGLAGEAALEVVLRHLAALQQVMAEGRRASGSGGSKVRAEATRHTTRDDRAADGVGAVWCAHRAPHRCGASGRTWTDTTNDEEPPPPPLPETRARG